MKSLGRRQLLKGALAAGAVAALPGAELAKASGSGPFQLAVLRPQTSSQWSALAGFDLTHAAPNGGVEVLLWPGDLPRLLTSGIPFEITVDDLLSRDIEDAALPRATTPTVAAQPGQREGYRTLSDYESDLASLAAARPNIAKLITLAETTIAGNQVFGIEIAGNVNKTDGRPTFYVDGLHHAREWPSGELAIMLAFDLVEGYGNEMRTTDLLDRCRVVVVPAVNPDGFNFSRSFPLDEPLLELPLSIIGQGSYWRKNRRSLTGDLGLGNLLGLGGLTAYGVDPNRNYAMGWGGAGASPLPVAQDHRGPAAFSEVESRNVAAAMLARGITGVVTNHTYSDLVLRPWGDTSDDAPDEALLRQLGDAAAAINGYTSQKSIDLYATTGTTADYGYAAFGAPSFTFEHGQVFHPAYGGFVPDAYANNREAFFVMYEAAADPAHHCVITGRTVNGAGVGTSGQVVVNKEIMVPTASGQVVDQLSIPVVSDNDGTFAIHVGPSTQPTATSQQAYTISTENASTQTPADRGESVNVGDLAL